MDRDQPSSIIQVVRSFKHMCVTSHRYGHKQLLQNSWEEIGLWQRYSGDLCKTD